MHAEHEQAISKPMVETLEFIVSLAASNWQLRDFMVSTITGQKQGEPLERHFTLEATLRPASVASKVVELKSMPEDLAFKVQARMTS